MLNQKRMLSPDAVPAFLFVFYFLTTLYSGRGADCCYQKYFSAVLVNYTA